MFCNRYEVWICLLSFWLNASFWWKVKFFVGYVSMFSLEHYMQNWPLKVSSGVSALAVCSAGICSWFLLLLSVSCPKPPWALLFLFFALFTLPLPVLAYCLAHRWPVLSLWWLCGISVISLCYLYYLVLGPVLALCYLCAIYATLCWGLCAISVLFLWYFFEIFVYTPCYLFLKLDVRNSQFQIW